jgi:YaiO family outer membrane protein
MRGIYRDALWYNRIAGGIIRLVHRRPLAVTTLLIAMVFGAPALDSEGAAAQGEPESRPPAGSVRTIAADYTYSYFQGDIDSWHGLSISVGDRRPHGSIVGRVNLARRFATTGAQAEGDAWQPIGERMYAFLNLGYSRSTIFPAWRSGAEIFRRFPRAFQASLGFRQLRFGGPPVTLLTGSASADGGNYWFALRPYVRAAPAGVLASASVTARRYRTGSDSYIGIRVGYGTSPTDDVLLSQLSRLRSTSASFRASHATSKRAASAWSVGYEREELSPDRFRNHWQLGGGLEFRY